jgi:hypothetical protein
MIPLQLKRDKIVFSVLQMPLRIGCEELRELARISNLLDVLDGIDKLLGTAADTRIPLLKNRQDFFRVDLGQGAIKLTMPSCAAFLYNHLGLSSACRTAPPTSLERPNIPASRPFTKRTRHKSPLYSPKIISPFLANWRSIFADLRLVTSSAPNLTCLPFDIINLRSKVQPVLAHTWSQVINFSQPHLEKAGYKSPFRRRQITIYNISTGESNFHPASKPFSF